MDAQHESHPSEGIGNGGAIASATPSHNLRLLLEQLDRPLERVDWKGKATPPETRAADELRQSERQHLGDLERAREAARAAFGVRPSLTDRVLASHILSKADIASR
ncbi:hypothetical protein [Qipengyuania soli]|uniref:Uncharacterized protein n=1 Tax=Qipengyuania soli TaxID=2782568 RepID=A0A7S8IU03_9SPHN|nr:hypothetical protein [Qipengyuania soli]QPC97770.1 hypothetical protein IRL76_07580 [Qipengyuania soli]